MQYAPNSFRDFDIPKAFEIVQAHVAALQALLVSMYTIDDGTVLGLESGMNRARCYDGGSCGWGVANRFGQDERLKIDGLFGRSCESQGLLQFLALGGVGQESPHGLRALLL